ncbi:DsbA family oxidoreductase [Micromonospora sp. NPDC023644]|uniref:DsbA family oxidoreductase n=1 Tax=Micromonospora sp. NPDC023644 TaxID=3154321 RepID=UPI003405689D
MQIEMYADVLCPWCYIGKRRLAAALGQVPDRHRIRVVWRSYELAPQESRTPGQTAAEAMVGWWADAAPARIARIRTLGAAEGLDLNLDLARPVNTFDAHRLCHLAADRGVADDMMERLLRAYHTDGLNIAAPDTLERLGVETGLAATDVRALLAGDAYADRVRADERRAVECGVTGVPSLVIDGRPPISAVQAPDRLGRLISDRLAVHAA